MKIAVIVPVFNRREITLNYLKQMGRLSHAGAELSFLVVDDASTDGTTDAIRKQYPDVIVLQGTGDLWWTGAINVGVKYALQNSYEAVLIMNDDLGLDNNFLTHLLKVSEDNPGSLVSSVTVHKDEEGREELLTCGFKRSGFFYDIRTLHAGEPYSDNLDKVVRCDLLTGASLFVPISVFKKIGIFDNQKFPHNWGDFEFTLRASLNGFPCLVATRSKVFTEYNPNYPSLYLFLSTRKQYLKNLFNYTKFMYGFRAIRTTSYMHRPFWLGTLLYARRLVGLLKLVVIKLFLPREQLRRYMLNRVVREGAPDLLLRKLRSF
jgi:GT2 family glycosyltransferase